MDSATLRPARLGSMVRGGAIQRLLAFGALILIIVFFSVASGQFFQYDNIVGILIATAVDGVLALGETFVIITGGIDLSVGTLMTLCRGDGGRGHHQHGAAAPGRHRRRHR